MTRLILCVMMLFTMSSDFPAFARSFSVSVPAETGPMAPKMPRNYLPVPLIRQATDYSCGAAALLSVLYYWNVFDGNESSLYTPLETTEKDGTEPQKIVDVAKSHGLESEWRENQSLSDLEKALTRGETAILAIQAWGGDDISKKNWSEIWDEGHYVVLVAMDKSNAFVMDPSAGGAYVYVPLTELLDRWHDYEDRHGTEWKYQHLGIFIRGKTPMRVFPGPLIRMD